MITPYLQRPPERSWQAIRLVVEKIAECLLHTPRDLQSDLKQAIHHRLRFSVIPRLDIHTVYYLCMCVYACDWVCVCAMNSCNVWRPKSSVKDINLWATYSVNFFYIGEGLLYLNLSHFLDKIISFFFKTSYPAKAWDALYIKQHQYGQRNLHQMLILCEAWFRRPGIITTNQESTSGILQ